jgi:RNA polymerase sigma-70 factor (ECF subfamily)
MLEVTQESVTSALKRARATVDNHLADPSATSGGSSVGRERSGRRGLARQGGTAAERRLVARLTDALERADLNALIDLLATDVRLSMPPAMLEYRGIETARRVFAAATFRPGRTYRAIPTRANGQPALGVYLADPHTGIYHAYCLLVITTADDHITAITSFNTDVTTRFALPRTLPDAD